MYIKGNTLNERIKPLNKEENHENTFQFRRYLIQISLDPKRMRQRERENGKAEEIKRKMK
jgi:hypothetical protein